MLRLLVLVGFCIPNPHVLIRGRITSMAMPYSRNPQQAGTHGLHAIEENGVFVALDLLCF